MKTKKVFLCSASLGCISQRFIGVMNARLSKYAQDVAKIIEHGSKRDNVVSKKTSTLANDVAQEKVSLAFYLTTILLFVLVLLLVYTILFYYASQSTHTRWRTYVDKLALSCSNGNQADCAIGANQTNYNGTYPFIAKYNGANVTEGTCKVIYNWFTQVATECRAFNTTSKQI